MSKLFKALCILLLLSGSLAAQVRTGNLYGKVTDEDGNPLAGVSVTLTGSATAPLTSITSAEGIYRFLSLPPARDYIIRCELGGFKTEERTGIIIVTGANVELNVTMTMGAIEEEVTVTAVSPVVDTKKTTIGQNVTQEVLQSLPTPRDPWVVLQMAPSVIVDRENVGGSESGQQSAVYARGAGYSNNVWAMDGIVITDPAAIGASPGYYDFDSFEELQITVGGADVTIQTGGVALNMVTRRGGNKVTLGGRFYMVDEKFQAKNADYVAEIQVDEPNFAGLNLIRNNKDYGFNMGGPLVKDKAWLWGSYGVQDIKTTTVYQVPDDTLLQNYAAKLNVQIIPENRLEAFMHSGAKNKWGRASSASLPGGYYQGGRYHFGGPILKVQDEHMFGDNLFVSMKYSFLDVGFHLTPMDDLDFEHVPARNFTRDIWEAPDGTVGEWRYYTERPVNQYNFLLNYFNDALFGASHDMKIGVEYADRNSYTESVYTGNMYYIWNINYPTFDLDTIWGAGYDGSPDVPSTTYFANPDTDFRYFSFFRGYYRDFGVSALAAYFSDTITFGRLNLLLGLRYDRQMPRINPMTVLSVTDNPAWDTITGNDQAMQDNFLSILPGITVTEEYQTFKDTAGNRWGYEFWSPRVGLTWDITGNGKTVGKVSFAMYGDFMGTGEYGMLPGGLTGWVDFYWHDADANGELDYTELYWGGTGGAVPAYQPYNVFDAAGNFLPTPAQIDNAAGWYYGGFDSWATRSDLKAPYDEIDPSRGSTRTTEFMLTVEREIFTDFAVTVNATYRRYDHFNWELDFFVEDDTLPRDQWVKHYETQDWYMSAAEYAAAQGWADGASLPSSYDVTGIDTLWDGDTGEANQHDWYYRDPAFTENGYTFNTAGYTPYDIYTRQPDYFRSYYGIDIIFNKRLSNKWMLNGSLTWQTQAHHFGDKGYMNPSNLWAVDGKDYAPLSGRTRASTYLLASSRWLVKAGGLYQLPYDFNVSFIFLAREGWPMGENIVYMDLGLPNTRSRSYSAYIHPFGEFRLNTVYRFDIRLEKVINVGDTGKIYLMADLFNVFNAKLENKRYQRFWGYIVRYADRSLSFTPSSAAYTLNELLNPRVLRLGVRFQF